MSVPNLVVASLANPSFACVGVDIGKNVFHVATLAANGEPGARSKHGRGTIVRALSTVATDLIAMEACAGSHTLARRLKGLGCKVTLLVPADVRPFVRNQKNDYNDAQAIAEAALRPTVRTVPIKSIEQQDVQLLHRARSQLVGQRTALINQIRAMLLEADVAVPKGRKALRRELPDILADADNELSGRRRTLIENSRQRLRLQDTEIEALSREIEDEAERDPRSLRLMTIPGVGPLIATALIAAIGDGTQFRSGRQLAAWLGLVPGQHSTGGKARLLGISKQGDSYLRWLLVHGARSVRQHLDREQHAWGPWLDELESRMHANKATCAVANKLARIAWAVLRHGGEYRPDLIKVQSGQQVIADG